jgi:hypothetical protein
VFPVSFKDFNTHRLGARLDVFVTNPAFKPGAAGQAILTCLGVLLVTSLLALARVGVRSDPDVEEHP